MIKGTKTLTTNGFTFEYIPSLRVLGVTSQTGGIEIYHQLSYEKASEIVEETLENNRNEWPTVSHPYGIIRYNENENER